MGNSERTKGRRAEQEVARIFRAHGFDVQRTPNSGGLRVKGDLLGVPGFHIEVKRQEVRRLPLWRRQAEAECGALSPVVIFRRSHEPWFVMLPTELATRLRLLRLWAPRDNAVRLATLDDFLGSLQTAPMLAGTSPEDAQATRETED